MDKYQNEVPHKKIICSRELFIKLDLKPSLLQEFAPIIRRFGIEGTWSLQLAFRHCRVMMERVAGVVNGC